MINVPHHRYGDMTSYQSGLIKAQTHFSVSSYKIPDILSLFWGVHVIDFLSPKLLSPGVTLFGSMQYHNCVARRKLWHLNKVCLVAVPQYVYLNFSLCFGHFFLPKSQVTTFHNEVMSYKLKGLSTIRRQKDEVVRL